ncbi:MAG: DNA primase [Anaerohalosphaeraceae bacterium]|nr:DNA primase [Anaerohalosphaeraceae bacterium]
MRFDSNLILRVQQANDIIDVVSEHLNLVSKGKEMVGLCPFHQDHKPSMYVNPEKQIFKCFACGAGGDVIKFVQMREGLTFYRAIERLAERAGIKIEIPREKTSGQSADFDGAVLAKLNNWTMNHWRQNFVDKAIGKGARDYLAERKITVEAAEEFGIGFAPEKWDDLLNAARVKKIPDKLSLAGGLIVERETGGFYDKFRNRLMFPIIDAASRVIGFGGRTLGDDPAKYMNSPATALFDKSNCVYALDKARHEIVSTGTVVVVEGYTDVIMAHQSGCKNVVATLGTSLTAGHVRLLRRYAKAIVLIFDSDIAGQSAAERALDICLAERIDIKIASVPDGKDPCDFILSNGVEAFKVIIDSATEVMDYQWAKLNEKFAASDNLADRRAATEKFLQTVSLAFSSGSVDAITKGLIINRLAGILQTPADDIRKELAVKMRRRAGVDVKTTKNAGVSASQTGRSLLEKARSEVIEVLLNEPRLFENARKKISEDDFENDQLRQLWLSLASYYKQNSEFSLAEFLSQIESQEAAAVAVMLSDNGQLSDVLAKRLKGAVAVICEHKAKISGGHKTEDEDSKLRSITDKKTRPDRRNPGMISI